MQDVGGDGGWVSMGRLDELPDDRCVTTPDGRVLVTRRGERAVAYVNRCLHKEAPLADGQVRDGVLTCPRHLWRYGLDDGLVVGHQVGLTPVEVAVVDGELLVAVPPDSDTSIAARLRAHAASWRRDAAFSTREHQR